LDLIQCYLAYRADCFIKEIIYIVSIFNLFSDYLSTAVLHRVIIKDDLEGRKATVAQLRLRREKRQACQSPSRHVNSWTQSWSNSVNYYTETFVQLIPSHRKWTVMLKEPYINFVRKYTMLQPDRTKTTSLIVNTKTRGRAAHCVRLSTEPHRSVAHWAGLSAEPHLV
jgi:hypothetical protein